jgi:hypothetical protein
MELKKVDKVYRLSWKETLKKIEKGTMAKFPAIAEDAGRVRVAASELNRETGSNYSISIVGNTITVRHK